jgi:hypothetical protein
VTPALVAQRPQFFGGEGRRFERQPVAHGEQVGGGGARRADIVARSSPVDAGDRLATARDDDFFAVLDAIQHFAQTRFRFMRGDLASCDAAFFAYGIFSD